MVREESIWRRFHQSIEYKLGYLNPQYMNARSTLITGLGFMGTFVERLLPQSLRSSRLDDIFNFLPISETLVTSGQPTELQLATLKSSGFINIINLAPHGLENSLKDEAGVVSELGMRYVHIPVDFKNPTEEDFIRLCTALSEADGEKTLVHCAANMRVSAFIYRYRIQILNEDPAIAQMDLSKIWQPFGVWQDFIGPLR